MYFLRDPSNSSIHFSCGVVVEPGEQLELRKLKHSNFDAMGSFTLRNYSKEPVEYRVKSRLHEHLLACRSSGRVSPGSEQRVSIVLKKGLTSSLHSLLIHLKVRPLNSKQEAEETATILCAYDVESGMEDLDLRLLPSLCEEKALTTTTEDLDTSLLRQSLDLQSVHMDSQGFFLPVPESESSLHSSEETGQGISSSHLPLSAPKQSHSASKTLQAHHREGDFPSMIASKKEESPDSGDGHESTLKALEDAGMSPKELVREEVANCLSRMAELVRRSPALEDFPLDSTIHQMDTLESRFVHDIGSYIQKLISNLEQKTQNPTTS